MCLGEYLSDEAVTCVNNVYTLVFKFNFLCDIFCINENVIIVSKYAHSYTLIRIHLRLDYLKFGLMNICAYNVAIISYALNCLFVAMQKENHLFEYGNVQFLAKLYL